MAPRSVADIVVDELLAAGIGHIFTTPAHRHVPLVVAARARGVPFVETAAPATAAVMAAVTGELVQTTEVLALTAADATGVTAGLTYARSARAPLLVVDDAPHEAMSALAPHLKWMAHPTPESARVEILRAVRLAREEPPGPVHVLLPAAVANAEAGAADRREPEVGPGAAPAPEPTTLDDAARLLATAQRPVLVVGLRCRSGHAGPWLRALAEAVPAPVLATRKGKGVVPDPHPLVLGQLSEGAALLARTDLIVTIGLDADEDAAVSWPAALPRLDLGVASAPAGPAGVVRVRGDVALVLEELAPRLRGRPGADWDVAELDRLKRARRPAASAGLSPGRVVEIVRALTPAGTIATVDEGPWAAVTAAAWHAVGPNELLIGAGAPGQPFAPAAAVAAALARPGARAVAFTAAAALAEARDAVATARRRGAPVVLIGLGEEAHEMDAMALSEDELARALHRAHESPGPYRIHARAAEARASPV
jgi:acetolactate synthase-1/2/3 large subunit